MQAWPEIVQDVQDHWHIYVAMPLVAALIGWITKVVAIRMMFRPYTREGIGPVAWQGIIPRRAPQMVDVLCETLTGRLISADEIIGRIDARQLATHIERPLRAAVGEITPRIAAEYQPTLWNLLPEPARDLVVQRAQEIAPDVVPGLVKKLRKNINDVFDLRAMVTEEFLRDPEILESMFLDVGRREFAFIRRSGLVFGFFIGLVQVAAWALFQEPLLLPIFGVFTGWFTDWAALRLIFNPPEPKKYLGVITWQGLFLKHRIPVSQEYGALIAGRVLTTERLVNRLFTGPDAGKVVALLAPLIEKRVHRELADVDTLVLRLLGMPGTTAMSHAAAEDLVAALPAVLAGATDHLDSALDIRTTMVEKMVAMTPQQFENVLRPAFRADEKTIIAIGAILGGLVGELQVHLLLPH